MHARASRCMRVVIVTTRDYALLYRSAPPSELLFALSLSLTAVTAQDSVGFPRLSFQLLPLRRSTSRLRSLFCSALPSPLLLPSALHSALYCTPLVRLLPLLYRTLALYKYEFNDKEPIKSQKVPLRI